jgi:hypothetical protein
MADATNGHHLQLIFAGIQYEEHPLIAQKRDHAGEGMVRLDNQAEHRRERGGYQAGFAYRPHVNEDDGVSKAGRQIVSDRYRDSSFANASGTHDGDEPLLRKFGRYQENFVSSSDYFDRRSGQTGMH